MGKSRVTPLDELRGDSTARLLCSEQFADQLQLFLAVRRAKPRREMKTIILR